MKYIALAAMLSAFALAPTTADAQSYREGSRQHSQQQRHDAHRNHDRDNRGNSRRAIAQRDVRSGAQHRGHQRPAASYRAAPAVRHYRPAPQRRVTTVVHVRPSAHYYPAHHYARYQRGQYLPAHYRSGHYYVDHRHYGFAPPPRGYRYARVDNDAILIGVATGLIAAVLVGAFH